MSATTALPPDSPPALPPDGDVLYEVINGRVVELPPMGVYAGWIASILDQTLGPFVRAQRLGRLVIEVLFRLDPAANVQRRPDLAFVSYERWPRDRRIPKGASWDIIPDLAIEVVSPTNLADDLQFKVSEYFRAGVRQVWVIYPDAAQVHLHESPTRIRVLGRGDVLEGEPLLPGFRLPLAELFEEGDTPA